MLAIAALAAADRAYTKLNGVFRTRLVVWSRSYDNPDPVRRSAMIDTITVRAPANAGMSGLRVLDRSGVDRTSFFTSNGPMFGYKEYDNGGACKNLPNVLWGVHSGIYDERCAADAVVDGLRFRTFVNPQQQAQLIAFEYITGPLTLDFESNQLVSSIQVRLARIGGYALDPTGMGNVITQTVDLTWP